MMESHFERWGENQWHWYDYIITSIFRVSIADLRLTEDQVCKLLGFCNLALIIL